jgi:hypothetical protein
MKAKCAADDGAATKVNGATGATGAAESEVGFRYR